MKLQQIWYYRPYTKVLSWFKQLHRTRQSVFSGDVEALTAGRLKINEEFNKHKDVTDQEEITKLVAGAKEANDYLKTMVVQAKYNTERDLYEVKIDKDTKLYDNIPFHGGDDSVKFKRRKDRKKHDSNTAEK